MFSQLVREIVALMAALTGAVRCHGLGSTASGTGAAQGRSLLCCGARVAKPALMARPGIGIIRLLPHSLLRCFVLAFLFQSHFTRTPHISLFNHTFPSSSESSLLTYIDPVDRHGLRTFTYLTFHLSAIS